MAYQETTTQALYSAGSGSYQVLPDYPLLSFNYRLVVRASGRCLPGFKTVRSWLAGFACVARSCALVCWSERVSASPVNHGWLCSGKPDFQALSGLEVNRGSLSSAANQCSAESLLTIRCSGPRLRGVFLRYGGFIGTGVFSNLGHHRVR